MHLLYSKVRTTSPTVQNNPPKQKDSRKNQMKNTMNLFETYNNSHYHSIKTWVNALQLELPRHQRSPNQIIMKHGPLERIDKIIDDKGIRNS